MSTSLRELPAKFFKGQDALKGPLPAELLAPSYRAEIAGFPPMDAAAHAGFGRAFYAAFPDLNHTIDEVVAGDGHVAVRFTLRGRHAAPFNGIPATSQSITVSAIVILTVEQDRVTHLSGVFDRFGLMQQLGVVPI
jgi:steroid delta-isomerase-like uncharacterized protein